MIRLTHKSIDIVFLLPAQVSSVCSVCTTVMFSHPSSFSSLRYIFLSEPPVWVIEPKDTRALMGSAVVIDCMVKGFPTPQVTWKRMIKSTASRELDSQVDSQISSPSSGLSKY